ncbi:Uncharacterised protein [Mycolicibacterium fortuitum]|uniref:Uncharacterized protein n=1 Tax=Mycolicibacterium fortuitum TaxID=1766 RepID=A0A378WEW4_MYCFO|nr:Uncharacterised protein [Mycolicibacterium fortuitum]
MNHTVESAAHRARLWFTNTKAPNVVCDETQCLTRAPQHHLEQALRLHVAAGAVPCSKPALLPHCSPGMARHSAHWWARHPARHIDRGRFTCSVRRSFGDTRHGGGIYFRPTPVPHREVDGPHNRTSHALRCAVHHLVSHPHRYLDQYLTRYCFLCLTFHSAPYWVTHCRRDRALHLEPTVRACGAPRQQLSTFRRDVPRVSPCTPVHLGGNLFLDAACRGASCGSCRGGWCGAHGIAGDHAIDSASWQCGNPAPHSGFDHAGRTHQYRLPRFAPHPSGHHGTYPLRHPAMGAVPNAGCGGPPHGYRGHGARPRVGGGPG